MLKGFSGRIGVKNFFKIMPDNALENRFGYGFYFRWVFMGFKNVAYGLFDQPALFSVKRKVKFAQNRQIAISGSPPDFLVQIDIAWRL
jgi:hypothetical protein